MKKNRVLLFLTLFCVAILKVHAQNIPIEIVNNSVFPDDKVYVAIIGKKVSNDAPIYYDLIANNASDAALRALTTNTNTLHKFNGDRGYANVFTTLNKIKNKTIYVDKTHACRMFFGFNSPLYLHVNDNNGGYAGADMQNPSDPNIDLRWELIEFTYDRFGVMFINTTRVDAFQYPMGLELYGNASAGANNPYTKRGEVNTYEEIINRWKTQNEGNIFSNCLKNKITQDHLGGIIMQPSKVAEVKNTGYFDGYINRIWNEFRTKDIHVNMGNQLGVWRGRVNGNNFVLKSESGPRQGETAIVGKPTSIDVIEGAGEFARFHGNSADLPVQAMFCGAMNRGVIRTNLADGELQDWGDTGSFFNTDVCNPYVKFFHQKDISYDGYTYAFAYDDTFDQSATCATSHPERAVVTIGGFKGQSGTVHPIPEVTAAPIPHHTPDNVKSVYSDTYTSLVPHMFIGSWQQKTATQSVSLDGNNTLKCSNFNYVGIEFGGPEIDATDMEYLHLDIYPLSSFTINVYPICRNNDESVNDQLKKPINLIANQWNSIDIPMSDFVGLNASRIFQFKFDNGKGETFYLDNLYFYKNGSSNGISSIETHKQDNHAWYNLQGQRMSDGAGSLPKGVYIHNGKKIFVK